MAAMAWSDVVARLKFWGVPVILPDGTIDPNGPDGEPPTVNGVAATGIAFTEDQKQEILGALQDLYANSPHLQALLAAGTGNIWLFNNTGSTSPGSKSSPGTQTVKIDFNEVSSLEYMGTDGSFHQESLADTVIHELIHAVYGLSDLLDPTTGVPLLSTGLRAYGDPNFDQIGLTQRATNQILLEAGEPTGFAQAGYDATADQAPYALNTDISYTEGNFIDVAVFDTELNATPNVIDLSRQTTDLNNLVMGFDGDDRINGNNAGVGGTNIVDYAKGAGAATINLGNGKGTIAMGSGLTASDVYLQADGYGNLYVDFVGDPSDGITVDDDLTWTGTVNSAIGAITLADGSSIDLTQRPLTFTSFGASNNYNLSGNTWGTNVFKITQGNGSITFGNNAGVGGTNIVDYAKGAGVASISLGGGKGTIAMGPGLTASDVYLQANGYGDLIVNIVDDTADSIIVHNDLTDNSGTVTSGIQSFQFSDGSSISIGASSPPEFTWIGTPNASLSGSNFGANTFILGGGSESASGGGTGNGGNGNNTYIASSNTGQATITANSATGSTNELEFTGGITDDSLWFARSGNDLKIDLLGTSTQVDVSGWFNGSSNQLQEITAGGLKIDSQISQLVQAMATYSAANPGFDPTSSGLSAIPNDANLQASVGAAWHS
jgi:hypothetical protein